MSFKNVDLRILRILNCENCVGLAVRTFTAISIQHMWRRCIRVCEYQSVLLPIPILIFLSKYMVRDDITFSPLISYFLTQHLKNKSAINPRSTSFFYSSIYGFLKLMKFSIRLRVTRTFLNFQRTEFSPNENIVWHFIYFSAISLSLSLSLSSPMNWVCEADIDMAD